VGILGVGVNLYLILSSISEYPFHSSSIIINFLIQGLNTWPRLASNS
jgi:hypothetical protein